MKTYQELKNFCEKNNVRYEIHPMYSEPYGILDYVDGEFKYVERRTLLGYTIGMNNIAGKKGKSEWQWTWFETMACGEEITDDTNFFFRERFSMLNGTSNKGWREGWNAENTIERRMA